MSTGGEPTEPLPEPPRGDLHFDFQVETEFFDALAELIPSGPVRVGFFERAIRHQLDRILELHVTEPERPLPILVREGFGLMISEAGIPGIPELLISFEYQQPLMLGGRVVFFRVRRAPPVDEAEDYSGDP